MKSFLYYFTCIFCILFSVLSIFSNLCVFRLLRLAATLTRRLETAERDLGVWDFGAEPFRLQKIAEHISPTDAGFICLLPCAPSPSVFDLQARRTRLFCLTSPLPIYMVGWGGAQAFTRERITSSVCSPSALIPPRISPRGSHLRGRAARGTRVRFGV